MKKDQIAKNVGHWVRLVPIAHRLDQYGQVLPQIDDEWRIESVTDDGVRIFLPRTGHGRLLGFDHLHQYTSDRTECGTKYGFLTLNVQLSIQGNNVNVTPTRPGEPVPTKVPQIVERTVEFDYPTASGMAARLAAEGYRLGWSRPERVATLVDLEGYEVVIKTDERGGHSRFRTRDGLVLVKHRDK